MLYHRLIPVVLVRHGVCVQSKGFRRCQPLGDPRHVVARLSDYASDELICLDISPEDAHAQARRDTAHIAGGAQRELIETAASACFMPLAFGGLIRSVARAAELITNGADKIAITAWPLAEPRAIDRCARELGSQCVVLGVDAKKSDRGWTVMTARGREPTGRDAVGWAREAESRGAGEILLQSVDRDGRAAGYDLDLIAAVSDAVSIPVIALGGVGSWDHLADGLAAGASAVAAANIFHHSEHSVLRAKQHLIDRGARVRPLARQPEAVA